jgi:hypothetical protein
MDINEGSPLGGSADQRTSKLGARMIRRSKSDAIVGCNVLSCVSANEETEISCFSRQSKFKPFNLLLAVWMCSCGKTARNASPCGQQLARWLPFRFVHVLHS